jgi:hypothetical protein
MFMPCLPWPPFPPLPKLGAVLLVPEPVSVELAAIAGLAIAIPARANALAPATAILVLSFFSIWKSFRWGQVQSRETACEKACETGFLEEAFSELGGYPFSPLPVLMRDSLEMPVKLIGEDEVRIGLSRKL